LFLNLGHFWSIFYIVTNLRLPIHIRRSNFKLPRNISRPIILIGPGTGFAPFRGFIQERDNQRSSGKKIGEIFLFFGCRRRQEDFIYEEEILNYHSRGIITQLYLAFSRDQVNLNSAIDTFIVALT
jgi:NADPH-ferrihemoprotein reductase